MLMIVFQGVEKMLKKGLNGWELFISMNRNVCML